METDNWPNPLGAISPIGRRRRGSTREFRKAGLLFGNRRIIREYGIGHPHRTPLKIMIWVTFSRPMATWRRLGWRMYRRPRPRRRKRGRQLAYARLGLNNQPHFALQA